MTLQECEQAVKEPGKFEGEARYVPHFYAIYLDGGADRDDGRAIGFDVNEEDRMLFPELRKRRTVTLIQRDDGFVVEV